METSSGGRFRPLETIHWNKNRVRLIPLKTDFECVQANCRNRLKEYHDFLRGYDEYQALDNKTKAEVDKEMIAEENEILGQECEVILAHWRRDYPNQFGEDDIPLANSAIPIEVDIPLNSPAPPVNPSPKLCTMAQIKILLDSVAMRLSSSSTSLKLLASSVPVPSSSSHPSASTRPPTLQRCRCLFSMNGAEGSSVTAGVAPAVGLARAATFGTSSTRESISRGTRFKIRL